MALSHEIQDQPDAGNFGNTEVDDGNTQRPHQFKIPKQKIDPQLSSLSSIILQCLGGSARNSTRRKHLVTSLLPDKGLETNSFLFLEAAPCTVGSRWSGHNLLGFVDQGVETWTAIDPGSIAEKKGSGTRLGPVFFFAVNFKVFLLIIFLMHHKWHVYISSFMIIHKLMINDVKYFCRDTPRIPMPVTRSVKQVKLLPLFGARKEPLSLRYNPPIQPTFFSTANRFFPDLDF